MRSVRRDYLLKVEVGDAEMNICEKKEDCPVVTVREAARYLGSSRNHVFTLIHSGALPILLLTVFGSPQLIVQAKKEGIKGFCCKTRTDCITLAIESLLRGETYFPESLSASAGD